MATTRTRYIAVGMLLFFCAGLLNAAEKPKQNTLTGIIKLKKDKRKKRVVGIDFTTNEGAKYKITMDAWGRKLSKAEDGGTYEITGLTSKRGKAMWLRVKKFKKAEAPKEAEPAEPPVAPEGEGQAPGGDPGGQEE
jgi:hypothetical protein